MTTPKSQPRSPGQLFLGLLAIPGNLLTGFLTGLVVPMAAIAAMVMGIRLITGKFPFVGRVTQDEGGGRQLALQLVPPEQVAELWGEHKHTFGDDLGKMRADMQAIAEEAKSAGKEAGEPAA
jgi:hypothetical protein